MKDIYKNPILYYILVPVIVGLWPLLVWAMYLPAAEKSVEDQLAQDRKAETIMIDILTLDPGRRKFSDSNDVSTEFTYDNAVVKIAGECKIPPSKYKLSSGTLQTTRGQKSQSATVNLKQIDIVKFAEFLSMIQLRWANLQCNRVKLTKKQGLPDMWDVDIEFKYYY
ncbi:MAG: hypothetical protein IIB56_12590 [Planctomycetes bacterium]|nr:hypothetical protein [Planctomycetota bacterium]MCH8119733.1 hypothetical protein [Planctomycetota bacterium]